MVINWKIDDLSGEQRINGAGLPLLLVETIERVKISLVKNILFELRFRERNSVVVGRNQAMGQMYDMDRWG